MYEIIVLSLHRFSTIQLCKSNNAICIKVSFVKNKKEIGMLTQDIKAWTKPAIIVKREFDEDYCLYGIAIYVYGSYLKAKRAARKLKHEALIHNSTIDMFNVSVVERGDVCEIDSPHYLTTINVHTKSEIEKNKEELKWDCVYSVPQQNIYGNTPIEIHDNTKDRNTTLFGLALGFVLNNR